MDEIAHTDPRVEIERLEERIEQLAEKLESCRKFVLASRIAMAAGGVLLLAMAFGVVQLDLTLLTTAFAAVVGGSNGSTAREAAAELAAAERDRAAMIGLIELRAVGEQATLH